MPKRFLIAISILAASAARAEDPPTAGAPDAAAGASPIEQLSQGSFADRQRATLQMWRDRDSSRARVQAAVEHADPEVAGRARWILRQWQRGSLPGTPPPQAPRLAGAPGGPALERLLLEGRFEAALTALEESAGTLQEEATRGLIAETLRQRFPMIVRAALANHRLAELVAFISAVADSKELALCRIELMQVLKRDLDSAPLLPAAADAWTAAERDEALTLILLRLGKVDQALEVAANSGDPELLYRCRLIAGRWREAAEDAAAAASHTEPGSPAHARAWSRTMLCADRAGSRDLFAAARAALTADHEGGDSETIALRWRTLASHGEIEQALSMLARHDAAESAALLAIDASRVAAAFEALNFPLDRMDDAAREFADRAVAAQRASPGDELAPEVDEALALVRCLLAIGQTRTARDTVQRICDSEVEVGALRLRDFVLSTLSVTRARDWMPELAIAEDEATISSISRAILARTLPDCDPIAFDLVFQALEKAAPQQPVAERVRDTCALFRGEQPKGFDPVAGFQEIHDLAVSPRRPIRGVRGSLRDLQLNLNVVRLFVRHGQSDEASDCLRRLVAGGDGEALQMLVDQELAAGSEASATALLDQLYDSALASEAAPGTEETSGDLIAMRALIGQWTVAGRWGDHARANELWTEIQLSLCAPSVELRAGVADYLSQQDQNSAALDVYEALLPLVLLGQPDTTAVYEVTRNYALIAQDDRVDQAARWFDLGICASISSGNYRAGAYVTLPLFVSRWSLEAAIQHRDAEAVATHLQRIAELNPLDIDLAERILPELRRSGMAELADRALQRILDAGIQHVADYPRDAMTANNLAWVAAMNNTRLSDALLLSRQAVYHEPQSVVYRDTLAEVLFRLGRHQEALQVERGCLLDDPSQWHLHQQVEKYQAFLSP